MKKNKIEFYIGGCRSGKSKAALTRAEALAAERRLYIATCRPADEEMTARVARHQAERGDRWETLEEPVAIADLIRQHSRPQNVVLVDCLTLWLTNLVLGGADDQAIEGHVANLRGALEASRGPVLLVANEIGLGIVPDNALGRRFRDWAGSLNQEIARCAAAVWLSVAGIAVPIKTAGRDGQVP
jgi:adenosylcobinamide kinase/adenosylcobinamide-phosphate guanylyltransferase